MSILPESIVFRFKLIQVILSLGSILPVFCHASITDGSIFILDFVYLTLYSFLGIGIIILVGLCIAEPVSDKMALYSTAVATIMHFISAVFIIQNLFYENAFWILRLVCGLCTGANAFFFGWDFLYTTKFVH